MNSSEITIKICGVRRVGDAELAVSLGASYIGCVLAEDSPRRATIGEIQRIRDAVAGAAEVVLVFRGNSAAHVLAACEQTGVQRVQIHGTDPLACASLGYYGLVVHPVFRVDASARRLPDLHPEPSAECPAVLDGGPGGAGQRFAWDLLANGCPDATLIAGGIHADNVTEVVSLRPFGIDVCSGVESRPGVKSPEAMRRLFRGVEVGSRTEVTR